MTDVDPEALLDEQRYILQYEARALAAALLEARADNELLLLWIVEGLGYPYDFAADPPIPEEFRRRLAEAWFRKDGIPESGESVNDWEWSCAEEGGWAALSPKEDPDD